LENNAINLSKLETELLSDTSFLLKKHEITTKIRLILEESREKLHSLVPAYASYWPPKSDLNTGKLSKGENYRLLPYQVLDFPRFFNNEHICTFRILCWWGHEISCTLHLQGNCLPAELTQKIALLQSTATDIYFCIHHSPWEYHFGSDNYSLLHELSDRQVEEQVNTRRFIKVSRKLTLQDAGQLPHFAAETFRLFMPLLAPSPL
jgi:hypothetical protein